MLLVNGVHVCFFVFLLFVFYSVVIMLKFPWI